MWFMSLNPSQESNVSSSFDVPFASSTAGLLIKLSFNVYSLDVDLLSDCTTGSIVILFNHLNHLILAPLILKDEIIIL